MAAFGARVVSEEMATFLESRALLTPPKNNKRKISTSMLSPSPPRRRAIAAASHLPPSPDSAISAESFEATFDTEEADTIEIPEIVDSEYTFTFLGFTQEAASLLWNQYQQFEAQMDISFIDIARTRIDSPNVPDATSGIDDWETCLNRLGINNKLRRAIMLDEFEDLRHTGTCKFWVRMAIDMAYDSLLDLDQTLRQNSPDFDSSGTRPSGSSSKSKSSVPASLNPMSRKEKTATSISSTSHGNLPAPIVSSTVDAPKSLDHHTMIWNATHKIIAQQFYNSQTGVINTLALGMFPGDLSGTRKVAYFTPQRETADRYAQWKKRFTDIANIVVIQAAVPETFTSALSQLILYSSPNKPTDAWKKIIWCCRRGQDWPKEFEEEEYKTDLVMAHIASSTNAKYEKMDSWTEIKDSDTLTVKIDGEDRFAMQWVFQTRNAREGFEVACSGKVWLHDLGTLKAPKME